MSNPLKILIVIGLVIIVQSCAFITRTEEDTFTITTRDTTEKHFVKNAPDNEDRGVIHPSTKEIIKERTFAQYDSVVTREYPNFIRLGLFESVGLIGGSTEYALNTGIFGVYPDLELLDETSRGDDNGGIFAGGMYRFGIYEDRLRWFRDAPNWTWGFHIYEAIIPDARIENALISWFTPYIRKRFYFSDDIPYLSATIAAGIGFTPSQYLNLSGSLDLGSVGGLNIRAYAGFAFGYNSASSSLISNNDYAEEAQTNAIPYAGIGVSVLDFVNIVPELYTEWKDHEHSSWQVGLAKFAFINTNTESSALFDQDPGEDAPIVNGLIFKLANASVIIPVFEDKGLYGGTSLLSIHLLGENGNAMGILPLRVGYWKQLLKDELSVDPFIEYGYYPSSYFNLGANLSLKVNNSFNVGLIAGYISGNTVGGAFDGDVVDFLGDAAEIDAFYLGIQLNILDQIFLPEEIRYNR